MPWPERLSLDMFTAGNLDLDAVVLAARASGVTHLSLQRRRAEAFGIDRSLEQIRQTGLKLTSFGGGGPWAPPEEAARRVRHLS
jgi:sugar phosphate isomerase/epimerase